MIGKKSRLWKEDHKLKIVTYQGISQGVTCMILFILQKNTLRHYHFHFTDEDIYS